MTNQLQTLNQRIAERVGAELVDLMPEGEWQRIVDAQLHEFKNKTAPKIINEMIADQLKKDANAILNKYCEGAEWKNGVERTTNAALIQLVKDNSSDLLMGLLSPLLTMSVQDFRNRTGY